MDLDELKLREIILNTRIPLVLKGFKGSWKCFGGTLTEWCQNFDESSVELSSFEQMPKKHWHEPQWERHRAKRQMTCQEFLKHCEVNGEYWYGLNYKRAGEIPELCREGVSFKSVGFPHGADDASFWLGSIGANTPCHYDTYGCNVVRQIYGRKSWLLLPPDSPLSKTRIPYEESSVYCFENFYSPPTESIDKMLLFKEYIYHCVLEPSDVLIVPRHWWHYAECVETSLSVNAWIPLECDLEAQIEECIVKFIIERFVSCEADAMKKYILNPNQLNEISNDDELFAILQHLIHVRKENSSSKLNQRKFPYQYLDDKAIGDMLKDFPGITPVCRLADPEYEALLKSHAERHNCRFVPDFSENNFMKETLINSICCPDVIRLIKEKFFKAMERKKQ